MLEKKKKVKNQGVFLEVDRDFVKAVDKRRKDLGMTRKAYIVACIEEDMKAAATKAAV